MTTQGYSRYRGGRGGGGRIIWIVALILVLLAAVGYLVSQRYVVYDESGKAHWELPFGKKDGESGQKNPISPDDVNIERPGDNTDTEPEETPTPPAPQPPQPAGNRVTELHARELEYGCLWWDPVHVLKQVDEAMALEVKRWNGGITYGTEAEVPAGVLVERDVTRSNLITLLQSNRYSVAHVVCFCDPAVVKSRPEMALRTADQRLWYDGSGRTWLDPASPETAAYLTGLCRECAELGFDEILLDAFCYPATGDVSSIGGWETADRTAALTDFAASLRQALPEGTALSVVLRGEMGPLDGDSGLTAELLGSFDRICVDETVDTQALLQALPEGFDAAGLAVMTWTRPESGGYVLLS